MASICCSKSSSKETCCSSTAVFSAVSPHWGFKFLIHNGHMGWVMLGGVLLSVTGAEAMYADLGHFTRVSIQVCLDLLFLISQQISPLLVRPWARDKTLMEELSSLPVIPLEVTTYLYPARRRK